MAIPHDPSNYDLIKWREVLVAFLSAGRTSASLLAQKTAALIISAPSKTLTIVNIASRTALPIVLAIFKALSMRPCILGFSTLSRRSGSRSCCSWIVI